MGFSANVDQVTQLIREVGADLMADFRYRREMLGPVEVWGLDRFDPNWMVVKGQIKTRPLQQWSVARAFNARLKRKMDEAGIEIPVPQMRIFTSSKDEEGQPLPEEEPFQRGRSEHEHAARGGSSGVSRGAGLAVAAARDVSHEPRPAPPSTGDTAPIPPQIPTAGDSGKT
jgi:small conductance mechanosensitive channel